MKFSQVVNKHQTNIAFVVGNGINRYNSEVTGNSWEDLLLELWHRHSGKKDSEMPTGVSATEIFDLMLLKTEQSKKPVNLAKEFCELMGNWVPAPHHQAFVQWAQANNSPILTTNFENTLGEAGDCQLTRIASSTFTDYYPWGMCYTDREISKPLKTFGIWHINGMQHYHRSIRLALTHYMGSVERARKWFYRGKSQSLFYGRNHNKWAGRNTWLQIVFNQPIAIFGLGLEQNEVFLRWLLIERAKFFLRYPQRKQPAWYIHTQYDSAGKLMFFKSLGIEPVEAKNFDEIYGEPWQ